MSAPKVQAVNCSSFLPVIFLKASAKWSNDQIILCVAPNASLKCIVDEANLILLALGIAGTVCTAQAQNTGTKEDFLKPIVPTFSLVIAKITSQEAGFVYK